MINTNLPRLITSCLAIGCLLIPLSSCRQGPQESIDAPNVAVQQKPQKNKHSKRKCPKPISPEYSLFSKQLGKAQILWNQELRRQGFGGERYVGCATDVGTCIIDTCWKLRFRLVITTPQQEVWLQNLLFTMSYASWPESYHAKDQPIRSDDDGLPGEVRLLNYETFTNHEGKEQIEIGIDIVVDRFDIDPLKWSQDLFSSIRYRTADAGNDLASISVHSSATRISHYSYLKGSTHIWKRRYHTQSRPDRTLKITSETTRPKTGYALPRLSTITATLSDDVKIQTIDTLWFDYDKREIRVTRQQPDADIQTYSVAMPEGDTHYLFEGMIPHIPWITKNKNSNWLVVQPQLLDADISKPLVQLPETLTAVTYDMDGRIAYDNIVIQLTDQNEIETISRHNKDGQEIERYHGATH